MGEDSLVGAALDAANEILRPPLSIERGAALLYEVNVNNRLELTVDPRRPRRGQSAFQTDLCVFDEVEPEVRIPRVVMEFKPGISTHDVLTYSAKAQRHKRVYPYLRYGLVIAREKVIPGRVFTHNEGLDFCVAAAAFSRTRIHEILARILRDELAASRSLEEIGTGQKKPHLFRYAVVLEEGAGTLA